MAAFLKGFLLVLLILLTLIGGHAALVPAIVLYFTAPSICFNYVSALLASWTCYIAALFDLVFRLKIIIQGDVTSRLTTDRSAFIILNHRTRFDWIFLFVLLYRLGSLKHFRIVLKSVLKHVPVYGNGMQMAHFIFLKRNWAQDKDHLVDSIRYYADIKFPVHLVFFPEGTDFSEKNRGLDREYSLKNNLPVNHCVLHPRTTGFISCMQTLRDGDSSIDIFDITVGYIGDIPQGEKEIILGHLPREVHFHIKHYPSSTLPSSDEELSDWLKKRWREKDELLTQFYQSKSFPGPVFKDTWWSKVIMAAALVKWLVLSTGVIYSLIEMPLLMTAIMGTALIIHYTVDKWFGGWDKLTLQRRGPTKL